MAQGASAGRPGTAWFGAGETAPGQGQVRAGQSGLAGGFRDIIPILSPMKGPPVEGGFRALLFTGIGAAITAGIAAAIPGVLWDLPMAATLGLLAKDWLLGP